MQRLYAQAGRSVYLLSFLFIGALFRLRKSRRVRVMVFDKKGQLLLVRNWFGPQTWSLPGGGCKYLEADQTAAVRELSEETGLEITSSKLRFVYDYKHPELGYRASVYTIKLNKTAKIAPSGLLSRLEIIGCDWFDLAELPDINPQVKRALERLRRQPK